MPATKRESSADSAARFRASHERKARPYRRRASAAPGVPARLARAAPRRIAVDFAEPTLRAIHEALLEQLLSCQLHGDLLNRTIIAEQMVAKELGDARAWPDEPWLDDRGVG